VRVGSLGYISWDLSLEVTHFGIGIERRWCKQDVHMVMSMNKLRERVSSVSQGIEISYHKYGGVWHSSAVVKYNVDCSLLGNFQLL